MDFFRWWGKMRWVSLKMLETHCKHYDDAKIMEGRMNQFTRVNVSSHRHSELTSVLQIYWQPLSSSISLVIYPVRFTIKHFIVIPTRFRSQEVFKRPVTAKKIKVCILLISFSKKTRPFATFASWVLTGFSKIKLNQLTLKKSSFQKYFLMEIH